MQGAARAARPAATPYALERVLFVVNQRAGDGRNAQLFAQALHGARGLHCEVTDFDIPASTRRELLERADMTVLFGGDGTLNSWLPELSESGSRVALFPAGTVNNLAHALSMQRSWEQLWRIARAGAVAALPLLSVNGRLVASYGTLGVGAENSRIMHEKRRAAATLRRLFPMLQTPIFAAHTILSRRSYVHRVRLRVDGEWITRVTPGIYVTRQPSLNKFIRLDWDPNATPDRFMAVVLKDRGQRALLNTVLRLYACKTVAAIADDVELFVTRDLQIEATEGATPLLFYGDGEPFFETARIDIELAPRPLKVLTGASHAT